MRGIFLVLVMFSIVGCNPIKSFEEMSEKQADFNELSLKRLGVEAQIGWNITNGKLNNVRVFYPQGTLSNRKVSEIETTTLSMVSEVFEQKPQTVTYGFMVVFKDQ